VLLPMMKRGRSRVLTAPSKCREDTVSFGLFISQALSFVSLSNLARSCHGAVSIFFPKGGRYKGKMGGLLILQEKVL
jgi:hypothetical protein